MSIGTADIYSLSYPGDRQNWFMTIGKRISERRELAKLTQIELAKRSRIRQPSISDLESGVTKNPKSATLAAIARVLRVDIHWLMTGKGEPEEQQRTDDAQQAELLEIYKQLPPKAQDMLVMTAANLHSIANGGASPRWDGVERRAEQAPFDGPEKRNGA